MYFVLVSQPFYYLILVLIIHIFFKSLNQFGYREGLTLPGDLAQQLWDAGLAWEG